MLICFFFFFFFFFNDTATTEIYTLSLHDALPISRIWAELHEKAFRRLGGSPRVVVLDNLKEGVLSPDIYDPTFNPLYRSEEHTSELQSQSNLVCRLLLEKKKKQKYINQRPQKSVG